jgi:uncharacterized protein YjbI with pentapeptide repeats
MSRTTHTGSRHPHAISWPRGLLWLASAMLVSACDQTVNDAPQTSVSMSQVTAFASDPKCGVEASWGESNAAARPACPGQTVVASLQQNKVLRIPLRIPAKLTVTYCFRDDNGEAHRAEIWRVPAVDEAPDEDPVVRLIAGESCLSRELAPGNYELRINHAEPLASLDIDAERIDRTPDVIHTRLTIPGVEGAANDDQGRIEGSLLQQGLPALPPSLRTLAGDSIVPEVTYTISVNDCPRCELRGTEAPFLYKDSFGRRHAGYGGNYRDAVLTDVVCNADVCELGSSVASDQIDFRGARISFAAGGARSVVVGSTLPGRTITPSDRFENTRIWLYGEQSRTALVVSNVAGARFVGTVLTVNTGTNARYLRAEFRPLDVLSPEGSFIRNVETNEQTVQELRAKKVVVEGNVVRVTKDTPLAGLIVNGVGNRYLFGLGEVTSTKVDAREIDFSNVTLRNVKFNCGREGSSFVGSRWTKATLENVDLSECNLEGLTMPAVEMRDVAARNVNFRNGTLWLRGASTSIDLSRSNLERLQVVEAVDSLFADSVQVIKDMSVAGSNLRGARFGMLRQKLVIESNLGVSVSAFPPKPVKLAGFVATNADLTDAAFESAELGAANFRGATLDGTLFAEANLSGAKLSSARGTTTDFSSTNLRNAQMDASAWTQAVFNASDMSGATFQSGLVCGGALADAKLVGTNLSGTLVATQSNIFLRNGENVVCSEAFGWETAQTDSTSRCPDGGNGRCSGQKRWLPIGNAPVCCDPFDDDDCPSRSSVGQACQNACECASLKCVGGRCG